jgi:hypothetical protein
MRSVDSEARAYIDAIGAADRPLFDRLARLVQATHPEAELVMSYRMPTFKVGRRRLFVGAWRHGLSIYGWARTANLVFAERHPDLITGRGTIRLRAADAARLRDAELLELVRAALDPAD